MNTFIMVCLIGVVVCLCFAAFANYMRTQPISTKKMSNEKYSKLHTRTFTPPDSREWHSLNLNLHAAMDALNGLNEVVHPKGSAAEEYQKNAKAEIRKTIVDIHNRMCEILQHCYR